MTDWSARVDLQGIPDDDTLAKAATTLGAAVIATDTDRQRTTIRYPVTAPTIRQATEQAIRLIRPLLGDPVAIHVQTYDDLRAELERPTAPPLAGNAEVAEILGVSRQRAGEIAKTNPQFPRPVQHLAAGPVYARAAVEAFERGWERKRTGRPRKTDTA